MTGGWEGHDHRLRREIMARIIVTPDDQSDVVLLDERVNPIHLRNEFSSLQVIERVAWAVEDADATARDDHEPAHALESRRPRRAGGPRSIS
jgi:hypothetical protein